MPRYRFSWTNLPAGLLQSLAADLRLDGAPADALRTIYGARPRADFVRDAWPTLLDEWLQPDWERARRAATRLRERKVGDPSERNDVAYLAGLRNTSGLRQVIIDLFIEFGEQTSDDRALVMSVSTQTSPFSPPSSEDVVAESESPGRDEFLRIDDDDEALADSVGKPAPSTLHEFVGGALSEIVNGGAFVDLDGDFVVPAGSAIVYVQVLNEPECVRVFSLMVVDVQPSPKVLELVNSINAKLLIGRLVYVNGAVILEHHLLPMGLSGTEICTAVGAIANTADYFDHRLQSELAGRIAMPERADDEIDV